MDTQLQHKILFFFQQFRQYFFHENTGAPCVVCDDMNARHFEDGSFFDDKSKEIYETLMEQQGEGKPSRE